jgi:hypothetical protein
MSEAINITRDDFDHLEQIEGESTLLGTIYVFGTPYHFTFVEVKREEGEEWEGVNDPHNRLEDINRLDEVCFVPTEIDGKLYIGMASPYGD